MPNEQFTALDAEYLLNQAIDEFCRKVSRRLRINRINTATTYRQSGDFGVIAIHIEAPLLEWQQLDFFEKIHSGDE